MHNNMLRRITMMQSLRPVDWIFIYACICMAFLPSIVNYYGIAAQNNAYLELASSLLKGKLALAPGASHIDMVSFRGNHYLPHPPFPALVLAPFVAIFGVAGVNVGLIAVLISCISCRLLADILLRLKTRQPFVPWLVVGFFLGTSYWYVACHGHSLYMFGHVVSVCLQLLVIRELLGKARPWLVGLLIGATFFTRQFTLFYGFFAAAFFLWQARKTGQPFPWKKLISMAGIAGLAVLLYLVYNYVRFGNPVETGYSYILFNADLKERVDAYGVFSARYVPFNFYSFFLKGFNIEFTGPGMLNVRGMDPWGTSLVCASPFLLLAVRAHWSKDLRIAAWITVAIMLGGSLFYHNNGFKQANAMRFSLDFLPLLTVLLATATHNISFRLFRVLVIYAILLNIVALTITFVH